MTMARERKIGERGQVTIPKEIREEEGIKGGDKVVIEDKNGDITIKKKDISQKLEEGYKEMSERDRSVAEELLEVTEENIECAAQRS